jgi:NADPH:quinone reductase-like Zn-dependent oxidoreductase
VQLVRASGAEVTTTGGEAGLELVTRLGAKQHLDSTAEPADLLDLAPAAQCEHAFPVC